VASERVGLSEPIRFGDDFELDARSYQLRHSGRRLKLERIPMELLLLLIEQRGQIVSREQIVERVWGKDVFLDTDNSINAAIRKIRQVLKDDPEQPRFVQTVTGRGYRFIAPVRELGPSSVELQAISVPASGEGSSSAEIVNDRVDDRVARAPLEGRRPILALLVPAVSVVLIAALAGYFQWFRPRPRPETSNARLMLAVLPFENLTGDAGQDYFSDGLTEEMITRLGNLDPQHLGVIARTSVMHYKNSPEKLDQIGRELGVQYVLEGSIRRDSEKVRITAQLIEAKDQTHLWARQYDREVSHLLTLEAEIAREIADEIQNTLGDRKGAGSPGELSSSTQNSPPTYEAYDLYLKGQYFFNKRSIEGFRRAVDYYQQAIARDPNYARAYAGLADSYALIGGYSAAPQTEFMPKARAAALRAVELDPSLPEAHTALALVVQNYDWDWQTSEKEFRRAIALNPNYATAHHWYAEHLTWLGRFDEAFRESENARQLDPLSLIIATDRGAMFYYSRQYDRAIAQFLAVREMDPDFPHSAMIMHAYDQKGMFAEVLAETETARKANGDAPWLLSEEAYAYGRTGQAARAREDLAKLEKWNRRQPVDAGAFVGPYIALGDKDRAFFWLEKAYTQHSNALTWLKVSPIYDPLRSDPRFQDLLRRVGLAQ
jgi:TolB-like protein/DNA-binding winged helix-turn-helix (wHTH) protein/Tfp pilus assembly protein PilF